MLAEVEHSSALAKLGHPALERSEVGLAQFRVDVDLSDARAIAAPTIADGRPDAPCRESGRDTRVAIAWRRGRSRVGTLR